MRNKTPHPVTNEFRGIMKQYEYFAADYRTGKKQLKRDFARDTVALFENENATLNDMREGRKALKQIGRAHV